MSPGSLERPHLGRDLPEAERRVVAELTQPVKSGYWSVAVTNKAWLVFLDNVRRLEAGLTAVNALAALSAMLFVNLTTRQGGAHASTRMR